MIYEKGITTGDATFQTNAPSWDEWDSSHLAACRTVAEVAGKVVGWAALSPVFSRYVYAGVAEVSVYIDPAFSGRGIGLTLLNELVALSKAEGIYGRYRQEFSRKISGASGFMKRQDLERLASGKR